MSSPYAYLVNGRKDNGLTPFDRGFAYGDGVFRTLPIHNGHPHCWERHYRRLQSDCNGLEIVCPSEDVLRSDIAKLVDTDDGVIKIIITRGESERGYAVPPLAQPTRVVIKGALPIYPENRFTEGVAIHLCQIRLSHQPRLAGIKHLNRLENVLARMEWVEPSIAEGLLMDMEGNVVECTMSNLFIRQGDRLVTPDLSRCGVAGVTRERIIEFASHLNYSIQVRNFSLPELLDADEVVICNSLYGAWQVRQLDSHTWALGTLASRLREKLYEEDDTVIF